MNTIKVRNLTVSFKNNLVLNNLSFTAKEKEFVVILGKSGDGKTTFLKALANLIPFSGKIEISSKISMVFQQYAVFPWMTVWENIAFALEDIRKKQKIKIIQECLELADLKDKKNMYPEELSGGQVQRIAFARAIASNSSILLMDEPYGALDAYTKIKMQQWLLKVWQQHKKTIVFVTHDIEEALFLADRILILEKGEWKKEFKIPFLRPRKEDLKFSDEFIKMKKEIYGWF